MSELTDARVTTPSDGVCRLYCPAISDLAAGQDASLDPAEARHARKVLRLRPGTIVELFDARGVTARAEILDTPEPTCRLLDRAVHPRPVPLLTLATAIPKGGRADDMIDQLVQLGVDRLIPLRSERSVVDPRGAKLERFERRVIEALKQCGRAYGMSIETVRELEDVLREPAEARLILAPPVAGAEFEPGDMASVAWSGVENVLALIGPEGGWTDRELAAARDAGFAPWTVNPHVLRIETAAVAAAALLRHGN